jgi:hypothetical protein
MEEGVAEVNCVYKDEALEHQNGVHSILKCGGRQPPIAKLVASHLFFFFLIFVLFIFKSKIIKYYYFLMCHMTGLWPYNL